MSITKSHDIFERFMNESCGSSLTCEQFMKVFFHLLTFGYSTRMMNSRSKFNQYLFSLSFLYLTRKGERLMPFAFLLFPAARDFILFPAAFGGRRRCRCPCVLLRGGYRLVRCGAAGVREAVRCRRLCSWGVLSVVGLVVCAPVSVLFLGLF